jgi:broad specificity phosphatase PhoE
MMKRIARSLVFLSLLVAPVSSAMAQRAVLLVRHAEKVDESADAALSKAGEDRAERLAAMLRESGITAILTSDRQRTIRTAAPLAALLKIEIDTEHGASGQALFDRIREKHPDGVVLVVGHSNTIPDLLKRLGSPREISMEDVGYGDLFILVPKPGGSPELFRLRYGS